MGFTTPEGMTTVPSTVKVWLSFSLGLYGHKSTFQLTLACNEPLSVTIVTVVGSFNAAAILAAPLGTFVTGTGAVMLVSVFSVGSAAYTVTPTEVVNFTFFVLTTPIGRVIAPFTVNA